MARTAVAISLFLSSALAYDNGLAATRTYALL
jgi:hypothetical protein